MACGLLYFCFKSVAPIGKQLINQLGDIGNGDLTITVQIGNTYWRIPCKHKVYQTRHV